MYGKATRRPENKTMTKLLAPLVPHNSIRLAVHDNSVWRMRLRPPGEWLAKDRQDLIPMYRMRASSQMISGHRKVHTRMFDRARP